MTDKRLSVVTNAIGYELFHGDNEGNVIWVDKGEVALAKKIAERVIRDLDEFDRKQPVCQDCGRRGHNGVHQDRT